MRELDKKAEQATYLHQQLLYDKTLELTLGELIRTRGIKATLELLLWWHDHLKEFET
jgi:hypothetical protein